MCYRARIKSCAYSNFILKLHNKHPERCLYPCALQLHKEYSKNWMGKAFHYFVVVKRTKYYLTISFPDNPSVRHRRKIHTDPTGMEYIKLDSDEVCALDFVVSSVDLEAQKYSAMRHEMAIDINYIRHMEHLEQYGYVYPENGIRITSIDELQSYYKDVKGWASAITKQQS